MSVQPGFSPVMWVGTYSLRHGPHISVDQGTNLATKPVLGKQDNLEATGFTVQKFDIDGMIYSTDETAQTDINKFISTAEFYGRPIAYGFFNADNSGPSSSKLWAGGTGYLSFHGEYPVGTAELHYPYKISIWGPPGLTTYIALTDSGDHKTYTASMTGKGNGFIAGVNLRNAGMTTSGLTQSIPSIIDDTNTSIGAGPSLGTSVNKLFSGNPSIVDGGFPVAGPLLVWPVVDNNDNQSIALNAPTGTYTVNFSRAFATPLPSAYLVYVQA